MMLGLSVRGKRIKQTALAKALDILNASGFQVLWLNIDHDEHKHQLISTTGRLATRLPFLVSPFVTIESPVEASTEDYIDAILGFKRIGTETQSLVYLKEKEVIRQMGPKPTFGLQT